MATVCEKCSNKIDLCDGCNKPFEIGKDCIHYKQKICEDYNGYGYWTAFHFHNIDCGKKWFERRLKSHADKTKVE